MANVMKPKVKETLIAPLTTEELELLIRATEGEDFVRVRDRALLLTLIDTGIRTSEACGLSVQDVDWTGRTLRIRNAKGGRERLVPFGEAVANALRKYMLKRATVEEDRLFITAYGEPISRYRLRHIVCGIARRAGIERPVYPHLLRHSAAVEMLRNGASSFHVQRVLGHATLAMTRKYCELLDDDLRQAHAAASPADRLQIARAKNGRRRLR